MMEKIRTAANSIVVKMIFGIIILAFIFTGVGGFLGMGSNSADDERLYIAKVDGEGISRAAFEREVEQVTARTISLGNESMVRAEIRQNVFLSTVTEHLAYKLSENLDIKISDNRLMDLIRQQPVFFVNGTFNNDYYLTLLKQNGYTPPLYAELFRADEQKKQLLTALLLTNFSLPVESELSQLIDQTREGYYANVFVSDVVDESKINIQDDEILKYYQENEGQLKRSDRVKAKFLMNSYSDAMKLAKMPKEEELKEEYNKNKLNYTQSAKYEFSLVQASNEDDAKKLNSELQEVKNTSHIENANLINLGWFVESAIPDYLTDNLQKKGESKVVEIDGSYYVAFLKNIQEQQLLPFEYVSNKIKLELFQQRTQEIYELANQKLLEARKKYQTLEEISEATGLELFEPDDWLMKVGAISIANYDDLQDIVFGDEMIQDGKATQNISDIIESRDPQAFYVIQVLDYRPEGLTPYDEAYKPIADFLLRKKSSKIFSESFDEILENLNSGNGDERILFSNKYSVSRNSTDLEKTTLDMIFSLVPSEGSSVYGYHLEKKHDLATVAVLTKVRNGDEHDISNGLIEENKNIIFSALNSYLYSKAKIEIMPNANL